MLLEERVEMTFAEFCQEVPCLEELEGFRNQRLKDGRWSDEDQKDYLLQKDRVERGIDVPAPSRLFRKYEYRRGRKPKLKKGIRG